MSHIIQMNPPWDLQSRFSSWTKLIRVTAYILRFIYCARGNNHHTFNNLTLTTMEIQQAETFWIKQIQAELFQPEITSLINSNSIERSSSLIKLTPYLDTEGVMRVQGRLKHSNLSETAKHPIILKSHPLVKLIIHHIHLKYLHAGPQFVLTQLRQSYWIIRARQIIRSVLYACVQCTRERAQTVEQIMGELPKCRVTPLTRAFIHVGLDYAGPILVRAASGRGHKSHKSYLSLFICMTTKAVHLELVSDYSTSAFIASFHRFTSRRGLP